jgi:hypothetical protein
MNNKSFLEELQSLDEPTKSKVLIITTIVIMAVVIYFWLGYFSSIVTGIPQPAVAGEDQPAQNANQSAEPGFFQRMGNGMATIIHSFGQILEAPRKYVVKPN